MPERENEEILTAFRPLVEATARRYCGKGALFDDLVQEGYLVMLDLLPRCENRKYLAKFLKNRLPARVRTAARRAWKNFTTEEELDPETFTRCAVFQKLPWLQWVAEGILSESDCRILSRIRAGFTQKEIADSIGLTQQAVSSRVGRIREAMARELGRG